MAVALDLIRTGGQGLDWTPPPLYALRCNMKILIPRFSPGFSSLKQSVGDQQSITFHSLTRTQPPDWIGSSFHPKGWGNTTTSLRFGASFETFNPYPCLGSHKFGVNMHALQARQEELGETFCTNE